MQSALTSLDSTLSSPEPFCCLWKMVATSSGPLGTIWFVVAVHSLGPELIPQPDCMFSWLQNQVYYRSVRMLRRCLSNVLWHGPWNLFVLKSNRSALCNAVLFPPNKFDLCGYEPKERRVCLNRPKTLGPWLLARITYHVFWTPDPAGVGSCHCARYLDKYLFRGHKENRDHTVSNKKE